MAGPAGLQHRSDVEPEAVAGHHDAEPRLCRPCREGGEARPDREPVEGEGEHLGPFGAEQRALPHQALAGADLAALEGQVDLPPRRVAEPLEQRLGHVLWADRAVEVDDDGPDDVAVPRLPVHGGQPPRPEGRWQASGAPPATREPEAG